MWCILELIHYQYVNSSQFFFSSAKCSTPWISMVYLTGLLVDIKVLFPIFTLQRMVPLLNIFKHHLRLCEYICSIRECLLRQLWNPNIKWSQCYFLKIQKCNVTQLTTQVIFQDFSSCRLWLFLKIKMLLTKNRDLKALKIFNRAASSLEAVL